jgi:hypothetical protein
MQKELHEVYSYLVANPDRAELVEAADELILAFLRNPKLFILPNAYKWATPVVEHFAYDLEGWVSFVREVLNEFPKRSEERRPLQLVYRKLYMRHDAVIRRERLRRAMVRYAEVYDEPLEPADYRDYERLLFQYWRAQRETLLLRLRLDSPDGKSTAEDRRELCDKFWAEIRVKIDAGEIPTLPQLRVLRDEAVRILDLLKGKK